MFTFRYYLLLILGMVVFMGTISMTEEPQPEHKALDNLIAKLKSEDLKELVKKKYSDIFNDKNKLKQVENALNLFYDLHAQWILIEGFNHPNYLIKSYSAFLLNDIAQPDDLPLAKTLMERIESERGRLVTGGSEVQTPKEEYEKSLLSIISKITSIEIKRIDLSNKADISNFLQQVKNWIDTKEKMRPEKEKEDSKKK